MGKQTKDGTDLTNQDKIPMDSMLPMAIFYYGTQMMTEIDFEDPFVTMGASLEHFNLLTDKQKKNLKPIKNDIINEQNARGNMAFLQMAFDDNLFNSFSTVVTSMDTSYSLRTMLGKDARAKPFL